MCGIFASSSRDRLSIPLTAVLDAIAHRGPDDRGCFTDAGNGVNLGQVRLSILDTTAAGHQPMADASGRFIIAFNGEVYNYRELRSELCTRHGDRSWRTGTDTEVIVEGFALEGIPFLDRLNGIFAIAIYDRTDGILHVLRDPLGIKPLFVTKQQGGIFLCSELKGLLVLPFLEHTLRRQSIAESLAFMYIPEPNTYFNEFGKVAPGICFSYRHGVEVARQPLFEHLVEPMPIGNHDEAVTTFSSLLSKAVNRQLVSDVPIALFLSGGLDSSAIAYEAVKGRGRITDAFTIAYSSTDQRKDGQTDDLVYARLMADRLSIRLHAITATPDMLTSLGNITPYLEDGITDPAALNTLQICMLARDRGVKVMLSGQGADEFLGGYRRYGAAKAFERVPAWLLQLASGLGHVLPARPVGPLNVSLRRLKRFCQLAGEGSDRRLIGMYTWSTDADLARLLGSDIEPIGHALIDRFRDHEHRGLAEAMMRTDHHFDLMSLNLAYTDRMSMAVGIETRVPFLDFELVRFMNSLPADLKIRGGTTKYILKAATKSHLPAKVIARRKAGFGLPIRAWLSADQQNLRDHLSRDAIVRIGIFDPDAVEALLDEQFRGTRDNSYLLFSILCNQLQLSRLQRHRTAC